MRNLGRSLRWSSFWSCLHSKLERSTPTLFFQVGTENLKWLVPQPKLFLQDTQLHSDNFTSLHNSFVVLGHAQNVTTRRHCPVRSRRFFFLSSQPLLSLVLVVRHFHLPLVRHTAQQQPFSLLSLVAMCSAGAGNLTRSFFSCCQAVKRK